MDIVVCIKQVSEDVDKTKEKCVKRYTNPVDLYALEEALRIKDAHCCNIKSISMGPRSAECVLRESIQMGVDEANLLCDSAFAGSDTLATAFVLSQGIQKIGKFDLIICGTNSVDSDTGQVGPALAEFLDIPHVTYVIDIQEIGQDYIICEKMLEDSKEIVYIKLPALVTIVKGSNQPRIGTIRSAIKASNEVIPIISCDDLNIDRNQCGVNGSHTKVKELEEISQKGVTKLIEGNSIKEQVECLMKLIR